MPVTDTITFKGATDSAFTTGLVTKTLYILTADPRRGKEGEDSEFIGGVIKASRKYRWIIDVEFWPFMTQDAGTQTTQDLEDLYDIFEMPFYRIESCTFPRWTDATAFPKTAGKLPFVVELVDESFSLNKEKSIREATLTFKARYL